VRNPFCLKNGHASVGTVRDDLESGGSQKADGDITRNQERRETDRSPLDGRAIRILSALVRRIDGKVWELKSESITQAFRKILKKNEISDLNFHDLRHEATSRLFELGLDATKVKEITGHKTYSMLARYTHLKAEDIAIEIDNLEKERDRKAVETPAERMDM